MSVAGRIYSNGANQLADKGRHCVGRRTVPLRKNSIESTCDPHVAHTGSHATRNVTSCLILIDCPSNTVYMFSYMFHGIKFIKRFKHFNKCCDILCLVSLTPFFVHINCRVTCLYEFKFSLRNNNVTH